MDSIIRFPVRDEIEELLLRLLTYEIPVRITAYYELLPTHKLCFYSTLLESIDQANDGSATCDDRCGLRWLDDDAKSGGDLDDAAPCGFSFQIRDNGFHYFRFFLIIDAADKIDTIVPDSNAIV